MVMVLCFLLYVVGCCVCKRRLILRCPPLACNILYYGIDRSTRYIQDPCQIFPAGKRQERKIMTNQLYVLCVV
jgi:hypothetical protein